MEKLTHLYPERNSEGITEKVQELKTLEASLEGRYDLSDAERIELISFERELGTRLESTFLISPISFEIDLDYLNTPEGKTDFTKTFGSELPDPDEEDNLQRFLYQQQDTIGTIPGKERMEFSGRSRVALNNINKKTLAATLDADGHIDSSVITPPRNFTLRLTPEKTLQKLHEYRVFKQSLKEQYATVKDDNTDLAEAKRDLINIYTRRVNELLAGVVQVGYVLKRKRELGLELTEEEDVLVDQAFMVEDTDRVGSRFDKFVHGADRTPNAEGDYTQVGANLEKYADEYASVYEDNITHRAERVAALGLDKSQLENGKSYQPEEIRMFAEEVIRSYGLLSAESPDSYDPDREGPAGDGGWQVIVSDAFTNPSVNGKRRVVQIPNKPMGAVRLFSTILAHEIEAHVLQHTNKSNLGLKIFEQIGGTGSQIFSEAGAKYNEDLVSKQAFGFISRPSIHYIRAMAEKLRGGNYAASVEAYYKSSIAPYQTMFATGSLSQEDFNKECKRVIASALNATRRLFKHGGDMESTTGNLTNSKDTVYLEQLKLVEELRAAGLGDYLYLARVDFTTLRFLLKADLLDRTQLHLPHFESLKIWEREKAWFQLKPSAE